MDIREVTVVKHFKKGKILKYCGKIYIKGLSEFTIFQSINAAMCKNFKKCYINKLYSFLAGNTLFVILKIPSTKASASIPV